MTGADASHLTSGWLVHLAAAACVAGLLTWLAAPPRGGLPAVEARQARGVAELASLIGASPPEPAEIQKNVREWSRFPPEEATGVQLAGALASCSFARVSAARRTDLSERVYAITNGSGVDGEALSATLNAFRGAASDSRCRPDATAGLEDALRAAARTDPRPRADWW